MRSTWLSNLFCSIIPCYVDICNKLQHLVGFAKLVWPRKHLWQQLDDRLVEIVVSTNQELRFLSMQGVCMTSSLFGKYEDGDIVNKLQEIYEVLKNSREEPFTIEEINEIREKLANIISSDCL
ncbi:uncharacterized protein [Spinacia oleracea]|uniref:Uncharacterized protein n=1 Tax=Spinacia oleracea TaxID=3562 RepID=A0ABM3R415_SPIOL|nr:uncharacterized protein LOC130465555 [Spinacia oleracea]